MTIIRLIPGPGIISGSDGSGNGAAGPTGPRGLMGPTGAPGKAAVEVSDGPSNLLVYYGYPIAYQSLWSREGVIAAIAAHYDIVVFGDTYQLPTQEVYADTVAIIEGLNVAGVQVFGYIPTNMINTNLTIPQIAEHVNQWKIAGAYGIFLDEFGFDYGNSRQRQIDMVNACHAAGMPYVANAWTFQDVGADHTDDLPPEWAANDWKRLAFIAGNPTNLPLPRNSTDVYLLENFVISNTGMADQWQMNERVFNAVKYNTDDMQLWGLAVMAENPLGVLDTTLSGPFTDVPSLAKYVWAGGYAHKLDAVGLNGYSFGASGGVTSFVVPKIELPGTVRYNQDAPQSILPDWTEVTTSFKGGVLKFTTRLSPPTYTYTIVQNDTL